MELNGWERLLRGGFAEAVAFPFLTKQ